MVFERQQRYARNNPGSTRRKGELSAHVLNMSISTKGIGLALPLWRQRIPRYPVYWEGNPQLQILLPRFWMKMVKPKHDVPPDHVHFQVHPQMSRIDIKNYLEKIYQVPVLNVRTKVIQGEDIKHPTKGYVMAREDDFKMAYVQLADGESFEFPDIFKGKKTPSEKEVEEYKRIDRTRKEVEQKQWAKVSLPPWFR